MEETSSRVKVLATSFFGTTPKIRSTRLPMAFISHSTGRSTLTRMTMLGPRISAMRSGPANAMFLGTISASTTCR